jgi:biotin carboxyl carrier protein
MATVSVDSALPAHVITFKDGNDLWVHTTDGTVVLHEAGIGERSTTAAGTNANEIRSTIPGKVAAVMVKEGDTVEHGATLLVLDSMKMEHPIRATMNGRIASMPVQVGTIVQSGMVLVVLAGE